MKYTVISKGESQVIEALSSRDAACQVVQQLPHNSSRTVDVHVFDDGGLYTLHHVKVTEHKVVSYDYEVDTGLPDVGTYNAYTVSPGIPTQLTVSASSAEDAAIEYAKYIRPGAITVVDHEGTYTHVVVSVGKPVYTVQRLPQG